jgi:epoxyqueuosine reductase QueG
MEKSIIDEIRRFVAESPEGRFPDSDERYFDEPLVGFVAADDPLFTDYKRIIGDFHLTPRELMTGTLGEEGGAPATVISWVLPITRPTRETNRVEGRFPSRQWAQTRSFGEQLNGALRRHLVAWLAGRGYRAFAPQFSPIWKEYPDTPVGVASAWSERHAAYAAGLGTFSLNDALITPRGIAHRLGSVITDLPLAPSPRPYPDFRHNCLWYREGTCGACIGRCPVGAISRQGHDKAGCREYVYSVVPREVGELYGVPATGCGLCQTSVPCEGMIPPGITRKAELQ